jgi:hypothetical protein
MVLYNAYDQIAELNPVKVMALKAMKNCRIVLKIWLKNQKNQILMFKKKTN